MKKSFPVVVYVTHGKQELQKKKKTRQHILYNSISFGLLKEYSEEHRNLRCQLSATEFYDRITGTICRHTAGILKCISARQNTR